MPPARFCPRHRLDLQLGRAALDSSASFGVPAHVTVLFPFLPATAVDDAVRHGLREIAGLPVRTVVREVVLLEFDGARWRRRASFALAPGAGGARTLTRCPGP